MKFLYSSVPLFCRRIPIFFLHFLSFLYFLFLCSKQALKCHNHRNLFSYLFTPSITICTSFIEENVNISLVSIFPKEMAFISPCSFKPDFPTLRTVCYPAQHYFPKHAYNEPISNCISNCQLLLNNLYSLSAISMPFSLNYIFIYSN